MGVFAVESPVEVGTVWEGSSVAMRCDAAVKQQRTPGRSTTPLSGTRVPHLKSCA